MSMFIIQTLIEVLLAFFLGWIVGRLLKGLFCAGDHGYEDDMRPRGSMATAGVGAAGAASLAGGRDNLSGARRASGGDPMSAGGDVDDSRRFSQPQVRTTVAPSTAAPADEGDTASRQGGAAMEPAIDADIGDIQSDNLQIIEGIGPKMESILHENGIISWSVLASKSEQDLRDILDQYGDKYRIINPESWIEQARLASEGKVDELIALQKKDGVSKLEKMIHAGIQGGFGKYKRDDLKIVEGIGPKIEALLNAAGIDSWVKLANTEVGRLQSILDHAGPNYKLADPQTWPTQAQLADQGRWDELRELQDQLQGGKAS